MYFRDYEEDDGEGGIKVNRRPPWWWATSNKQPCECGAKITITDGQGAYSDGGYYRVRCTACGHVWAYYIEG